jgi:hypothetical protein
MTRRSTCFTRTFRTPLRLLISTAALARCPGALTAAKLFQQFVCRREKPLKRLFIPRVQLHRAKAAVLLRDPVAWRQPFLLLSLLACTLLIPLTLRADGLSDLRSVLEKLKATQPIKARVKAEVSANVVDDSKPTTATGTMEVLVEHNESGIAVRWAQTDLQKVREEADKKNGNPNSVPILRQTMDSFEAALMRSLVDQSDRLLRDLQSATVESDAKETRNGAPLRKLVLKLNRALSESEKKSVKTISTTLHLWVNDAGIPVCSEEKTDLKGSRFFISFDSTEGNKKSYQVVGDRLVVTQLETSSAWSVPIMGSYSHTNKFTVTVQ